MDTWWNFLEDFCQSDHMLLKRLAIQALGKKNQWPSKQHPNDNLFMNLGQITESTHLIIGTN